MFFNVAYVIHVFASLKKSAGRNMERTKRFNIIGYLYIALLLAFAADYILISVMNTGDDPMKAAVMAQILFWGAVFVLLSIYVFSSLLTVTNQQLVYELSDLKISLETYIKSIPGGVHHCVVDPEMRVSYVSKGFTDITGYTIEEINELYGGKYTGIIYEEDRELFAAKIEHLLKTMSEVVTTYRVTNKRGELIWVSDSMNAMTDSKGQTHIFAVVLDITAEKANAERDALTGLLNKGAFHAKAREYIKRNHDKGLGLFMIDLNFFKEVNDIYGHQSGDTVLVNTAAYITSSLSQRRDEQNSDFLMRLYNK